MEVGVVVVALDKEATAGSDEVLDEVKAGTEAVIKGVVAPSGFKARALPAFEVVEFVEAGVGLAVASAKEAAAGMKGLIPSAFKAEAAFSISSSKKTRKALRARTSA